MTEAGCRLREATESERRERDRASSQTWKRKLTQEQYGERLQHLREIPFTRKNIHSWVLMKGDMVVASCDTVRMPSILNENQAHGMTECISRMYVEPGMRGKGYAADLLSELVGRARQEELQATVIFTEANARLYSQYGFRTLRGFNWVFSHDEAEKIPAVDLAQVAPVLRTDLARLVVPAGLKTNGKFVLVADEAQVDWHLKRASSYAQAYKRPAIEAIGAKMGDAFVLWAHDFLTRTLQILWIHISTREQAQALLSAALKEAFAFDLKMVLLKQSPSINALVDFCRRSPELSLPMILPISPDLRASDWTEVSFVHQF